MDSRRCAEVAMSFLVFASSGWTQEPVDALDEGIDEEDDTGANLGEQLLGCWGASVIKCRLLFHSYRLLVSI